MTALLETQHTEHGLDPGEAIHWQDLDSSRQEVVQLCGEKGRALFSFFLASSTREENTAVVPLTRLADIARQLGWSADTVKRYVAVFRAINLVSHYRGKLLLPLGIYTPLTTFSALDELAGKRDKQRQLALKVKARYILRYGDPSQSYSEHMRQTLQGIKAILDDEHLEPLKRERLQMKIAEMITNLAGIEHYQGDPKAVQGDVPANSLRQKPDRAFAMGDPNARQRDRVDHIPPAAPTTGEDTGDPNVHQGDPIISSLPSASETKHEGDLKNAKGDSVEHTSLLLRSLRSAEKNRGDSNTHQGDPKSSTPFPSAQGATHKGDLKATQGDPKPHLSPQGQETTGPMGDSDAIQGDLKAYDKGLMGDSNGQVVLKEGDLTAQARSEALVEALPTYNVNYLISNITSNNVKRSKKHDDVKRNEKNEEIAKFLARVLEKYEYEGGKPTFRKYLAAFNHYTPEVIGRAFLVTMVLLHQKRWSIRNLGATFTYQCKTLSGDPDHPFDRYTLEDVETWLKIWGDLPYPELITTLESPEPEPTKPEPAQLVKATESRTGAPSASASKRLTGYAGYSHAYPGKPQRTYGMHYSRLGSGRYNTGTSRPPEGTNS